MDPGMVGLGVFAALWAIGFLVIGLAAVATVVGTVSGTIEVMQDR